MDHFINEVVNNGEKFYLLKDYKDINHYRQSLNRLTMQTYGFDFEQWYQQGYWSNKYRPYSLLHNDQIIANISVNPIDYLVNGDIKRALQIGTVMTDKAYRHRGLSRELMKVILEEYQASSELIYLYANDSVLQFYPKFGFTQAKEFIHSKLMTETGDKLPYRKLDLGKEEDKTILVRLVTGTIPVSKYAMIDNPYLMLFHLTSYMAGDVYYFEELELAAVVTWEEEHIFITDLFCERDFDMDLVLRSLIQTRKSKIILGFTPKDDSSYTIEELREEGSTFYVKGQNFLEKGRFSILSHA